MSFKLLVVGALFVASGCTDTDAVAPESVVRPSFQQAPSDGNGNKIVNAVDFVLPAFTTCPGGATLDLHIVGWGQDRPGDARPGNGPGVVTFHYRFIYSNAAGATYVWEHTGLALFQFNENGDLIMSLGGRLSYDGIGRTVINLTTGTVEFRAGNNDLAEDLACSALT